MSTAAEESSFKVAYETLQRNAQMLRDQEEPDIDNLLQLVQSSISAYNTCKQRIDAVDEALTKAFAREDVPGAAG